MAFAGEKADVCHLEGNGFYHLINVSVNALPAHLAHGDGIPGEGFLLDCTPLIVEEGPITYETDQPSVRYRSFANTGGQEIYIGKQDLGNPINRADADNHTWGSGLNYFVFSYDANTGVLSTTVTDGTTTTSSGTIALGDGTCGPDNWNALEILVLNRDTGTTVNLNDLAIDSVSLGMDFTGGTTFADGTWHVTYPFGGNSFDISGSIELGGIFSTSQELSKVQLIVGCN